MFQTPTSPRLKPRTTLQLPTTSHIQKSSNIPTSHSLKSLKFTQISSHYSSFPIHKILLILLLSHVTTLNLCSAHYTNKWSMQVDGGPERAHSIAKRHGFRMVDEVVPGIYELEHHGVKRMSLSPSHRHHHLLNTEDEIIWHEQQTSLQRDKRDLFTDPDWPKQWYMNRGTNDMNILGVYSKYRLSGRGVVVSILDDGLEFNHTDLYHNYDPVASFDFNDNDSDPTPRYEFTNFNRHGTRCAGEVSSVANNTKCGVGIAYNSKIGGIRMLDGRITDTLEGRALFFQNQHIHLYSASWGPSDTGKLLEGPGKVAQRALYLGVTKGRGGLGSIYVWASGNGGRSGDNCNCDGYTSNIFTISISSAGKDGSIPAYNERCPSTLATTYSSGDGYGNSVVTTDLRNECTQGHSGTSASAPMAAAIFALALEANPLLTWRDLQYLVVMTSHKKNLLAPDWSKNALGRYVSHAFGYGLLDAEKLVMVAEDWVRVPEQVICVMQANFEPVNLTENSNITIELTVQQCQRSNLTTDLYKFHYRKGSSGTQRNDTREGESGNFNQEFSDKKVNFLEHVQAMVTLTSNNRGQVELLLTSPGGTVSQLLGVREKDTSKHGIREWPFTTVHSWGERSEGVWKLTVVFHQCKGTLTAWKLVLYGTEEDPLQKQIYPPRKLKPTEKTCQKWEYYLNNSCYHRCPSMHYPSSSYLSVILQHDNPFNGTKTAHNKVNNSSSENSKLGNSHNSNRNINSSSNSHSVSIRSTEGGSDGDDLHYGDSVTMRTKRSKHVPDKKNDDDDEDDDGGDNDDDGDDSEDDADDGSDDSSSSERNDFSYDPTSFHPSSHPLPLNPYDGEINKEMLKEGGEEILKTRICFPCHPSCLTCTGPRADECLKCMNGHYFTIDRFCLPDSGYKIFFQRSSTIIFITIVAAFIIFLFLLLLFSKCEKSSKPIYSPLKCEEDGEGKPSES